MRPESTFPFSFTYYIFHVYVQRCETMIESSFSRSHKRLSWICTYTCISYLSMSATSQHTSTARRRAYHKDQKKKVITCIQGAGASWNSYPGEMGMFYVNICTKNIPNVNVRAQKLIYAASLAACSALAASLSATFFFSLASTSAKSCITCIHTKKLE